MAWGWKDFIADPARFLMLDNRTLTLGNHGSPNASGMTEASPLAGSGLASLSTPGAYRSDAVNRSHASALKVSVPPSRLVVSQTSTLLVLATSTQALSPPLL